MSELLNVARVAKAFGGNRVLTDVSFTVRTGEIVGLLGPNGSGKSTLLNGVSGFTPLDAGSVRLDGRDLAGRRAHEIVRAGVGRTFQLPSMPRMMSVLEVTLAACTDGHGLWPSLRGGRAARARERSDIDRALAVLDDLLLTTVKDLPAASLSGGQKKLLGIACALMGSPRLLMLDEPTAGVHPNLRRDIVQTLKDLNRRGLTQVIVEHDMHFIREVCTRCIVLDRGEIVADCHPTELESNARVLEAYLGQRQAAAPRPPVQECRSAA